MERGEVRDRVEPLGRVVEGGVALPVAGRSPHVRDDDRQAGPGEALEEGVELEAGVALGPAVDEDHHRDRPRGRHPGPVEEEGDLLPVEARHPVGLGRDELARLDRPGAVRQALRRAACEALGEHLAGEARPGEAVEDPALLHEDHPGKARAEDHPLLGERQLGEGGEVPPVEDLEPAPAAVVADRHRPGAVPGGEALEVVGPLEDELAPARDVAAVEGLQVPAHVGRDEEALRGEPRGGTDEGGLVGVGEHLLGRPGDRVEEHQPGVERAGPGEDQGEPPPVGGEAGSRLAPSAPVVDAGGRPAREVPEVGVEVDPVPPVRDVGEPPAVPAHPRQAVDRPGRLGEGDERFHRPAGRPGRVGQVELVALVPALVHLDQDLPPARDVAAPDRLGEVGQGDHLARLPLVELERAGPVALEEEPAAPVGVEQPGGAGLEQVAQIGAVHRAIMAHVDQPTRARRALALARLDRRPLERPPSPTRVLLATLAALGGSLGADAALVAIGTALFPSTRGYAHFRFSDYGLLTVIGVLIACAAWPVTARVTSAPRWLFSKMAVLVTLALWLPDLYLLAKGEPGRAVGVLMAMHLAIALVTYHLLVRLAPLRPAGPVGGQGVAAGPATPLSGGEGAGQLRVPGGVRRGSPRRLDLRRLGVVMASLVGLETALGIVALVVVPYGRPAGLLPAHGRALYLAHAAVGGVLGLLALGLLAGLGAAGRIERIGTVTGLVGVLVGAGGGLATTAHPTRLLGVCLMLLGAAVAGFGYLVPVIEPAPPSPDAAGDRRPTVT